MRSLFPTYRILAFIVGVLLLFGTFVAFPLRHFLPEGTSAQQLGERLSWGWVVHGFVYIAYLVVAFLLARQYRWSLTFTLTMLAAGLIPIFIFWVERQVAHRVATEPAPEPTG
ncbi:MAG: DUF3817 domain-containing protein [Nocardioides sp.]